MYKNYEHFIIVHNSLSYSHEMKKMEPNMNVGLRNSQRQFFCYLPLGALEINFSKFILIMSATELYIFGILFYMNL